MTEWWSGLSARERMMILVAGLLALIIGSYQLLYVPLSDGKAKAERAYMRQALETQQTLEGLARLREAETPGKTVRVSTESLELLLSRSATNRGLDIIRIDSAGDNEKTVWFDQAAPGLVAPWVYELESQQGLTVTALDLRKQSDANALRGSITFRRGN